MATRTWNGGTTAVTQVSTATLSGSWAGDGNIVTTLTDENAGTATVTTASNATIQTGRDTHLAALQASTNALFLAITWTSSGTDKIVATAKVSGTPFYIATTTTDSTGVVGDVATTANAGPNDWNTAANWSASTVPVDGDTVIINGDDYDILFGLNQSAIDLVELQIGPGYGGIIGQPANAYELMIDVSNTTPRLRINTISKWIGIRGALDNINVVGLPSDAHLYLGGTIDNLRCSDSGVMGTVHVLDSADIDNVYAVNTPAAKYELGDALVSLDIIEMDNGGYMRSKTGGAALDVNLGNNSRFVYDDVATEAIDNVNLRGGTFLYNGTGGIATKLSIWSGAMDFRGSDSTGATIGATEIWAGSLDAGANITFTGNIIRHGGIVNAAAGDTVDVSA